MPIVTHRAVTLGPSATCIAELSVACSDCLAFLATIRGFPDLLARGNQASAAGVIYTIPRCEFCNTLLSGGD